MPNVINKTIEAVRHLPPDWDIFYIGGKVFTDFAPNVSAEHYYKDSNTDTLERDICRGLFGKGVSPLAPDGSRRLSEDQPYWRTLGTSNTHAYVLNPRRIDKILDALHPRKDIPIDIAMGDAMYRGDLYGYMPTQDWCGHAGTADLKGKRTGPKPWEGYLVFPAPKNQEHRHPALRHLRDDPSFIWHRVHMDNCAH